MLNSKYMVVNTRPLLNKGFSLIEVSIVLVIIGLLMGGLLTTFSSSQRNNFRSETNADLLVIEQALYGFAQVNGRLPCPARANSNGIEVCPSINGIGFIPGATLGLSGDTDVNNLFLDAWDNPYRYMVTTQNAGAFYTQGSMRTIGMSNLTPDITICTVSSCNSSEVITNIAPAVVLSMGENWTNFSSANERSNSGETTVSNSGISYRMPNNNLFVKGGYSQEFFDDHIIWISPSVLYSKMIKSGQLP